VIAMGLGPLAAHASKFPCLRGPRLLNERFPRYFHSAQEESCIPTDTIESRSTGVFVYLRMTARACNIEQCQRSFGVKRGDRIEAHGAQRRDVTRGDGDGGEHGGDACEGGEVVGRDTVKQAGHEMRKQ
jgi:hypothetical protein